MIQSSELIYKTNSQYDVLGRSGLRSVFVAAFARVTDRAILPCAFAASTKIVSDQSSNIVVGSRVVTSKTTSLASRLIGSALAREPYCCDLSEASSLVGETDRSCVYACTRTTRDVVVNGRRRASTKLNNISFNKYNS